MRVNNVFSGRPAYYDRGPLQKVLVVGQTSAPQALGNIVSYTVPTARKALVESATCKVIRASVATTALLAESVVGITPSGLGQSQWFGATINTNNVGDRDGLSGVGTGTLLAGDAIAQMIGDSSTGGTVTYVAGLKILEYDA